MCESRTRASERASARVGEVGRLTVQAALTSDRLPPRLRSETLTRARARSRLLPLLFAFSLSALRMYSRERWLSLALCGRRERELAITAPTTSQPNLPFCLSLSLAHSGCHPLYSASALSLSLFCLFCFSFTISLFLAVALPLPFSYLFAYSAPSHRASPWQYRPARKGHCRYCRWTFDMCNIY